LYDSFLVLSCYFSCV